MLCGVKFKTLYTGWQVVMFSNSGSLECQKFWLGQICSLVKIGLMYLELIVETSPFVPKYSGGPVEAEG